MPCIVTSLPGVWCRAPYTELLICQSATLVRGTPFSGKTVFWSFTSNPFLTIFPACILYSYFHHQTTAPSNAEVSDSEGCTKASTAPTQSLCFAQWRVLFVNGWRDWAWKQLLSQHVHITRQGWGHVGHSSPGVKDVRHGKDYCQQQHQVRARLLNNSAFLHAEGSNLAQQLCEFPHVRLCSNEPSNPLNKSFKKSSVFYQRAICFLLWASTSPSASAFANHFSLWVELCP